MGGDRVGTGAPGKERSPSPARQVASRFGSSKPGRIFRTRFPGASRRRGQGGPGGCRQRTRGVAGTPTALVSLSVAGGELYPFAAARRGNGGIRPGATREGDPVGHCDEGGLNGSAQPREAHSPWRTAAAGAGSQLFNSFAAPPRGSGEESVALGPRSRSADRHPHSHPPGDRGRRRLDRQPAGSVARRPRGDGIRRHSQPERRTGDCRSALRTGSSHPLLPCPLARGRPRRAARRLRSGLRSRSGLTAMFPALSFTARTPGRPFNRTAAARVR